MIEMDTFKIRKKWVQIGYPSVIFRSNISKHLLEDSDGILKNIVSTFNTNQSFTEGFLAISHHRSLKRRNILS